MARDFINPPNVSSNYHPVFEEGEYMKRLHTIRNVLLQQRCVAFIMSSPDLLNYFTGFDGWGFYTPQFLVITSDRILLAVREMDAPAAYTTTYLQKSEIMAYSDEYVDSNDMHPLQQVYREFVESECKTAILEGNAISRIGLEMDSVYFRARYLAILQAIITEHICLTDCTTSMHMCRLVKSEAELERIRKAAIIADKSMAAALDMVHVGSSGADVASKVAAIQAGEGAFTAIQPMIMVNEDAAHMNWTATPFAPGQRVEIEIAGSYDHYHCPISRTIILTDALDAKGQSNTDVVCERRRIANAILHVLDLTVEHIRAGVTCDSVHRVFVAAMECAGLDKRSRVGYSFGLGFPPDWGEGSVSIRAGDMTMLQPNMCLHLIIGCGDTFGFQTSEAVIVHEDRAELLCKTPRQLFFA